MKNSPRILLLFVLITLVTILCATCKPYVSNQNGNTSQAEQPSKSPLPPPTGFVNDYSNVLDEATKNQLESTLAHLKERSAIEFAVVFIDTTEGQPINDYSMAVARGWGIGSKDRTKGGGLLLLIAVKDREWQIEISRSLEKDLPNEVALELGQIMNEPFRQEKYGDGVTKCIDAIIARVGERRGFVMEKVKRIEVDKKGRP